MGDGREHNAPGRGSAIAADDDAASLGTSTPAVGKRTLTEQLGPGGAQPASTQPAAPDGEDGPVAGTKKPTISGTIVEGGPLSDADVDGINEAAKHTPARFKRYIAYAGVIKVGGSL